MTMGLLLGRKVLKINTALEDVIFSGTLGSVMLLLSKKMFNNGTSPNRIKRARYHICNLFC